MTTTQTTAPATDLTQQSPVEIDTALAKAHGEMARAASYLDHYKTEVHRYAGDKRKGGGHAWSGSGSWGMTLEEAVKAVEAQAIGEYVLGSLKECQEKVASLRAEIKTLDAEFTRRGGWSRFFLVTNAGGHIHSSMDCSTCNKVTSRGWKPTSFAWLPDLSASTEAEAVEAHGAILCTVCFPSAPVEWTNKYEVEQAARKAARCPGSGTFLDRDQPHRVGYYSGNWGTCPECGVKPALTGSHKLRAHKPGKLS